MGSTDRLAPGKDALRTGRPLAFADDRQPGAVDDEMDGFVGMHAVEPDIEVPTTPRERGGNLKTSRRVKAVWIT